MPPTPGGAPRRGSEARGATVTERRPASRRRPLSWRPAALTSVLTAGLAALLAATAAPALAHEAAGLTEANAWSTWPLSWDIVVPSALLAAVYGAGMLRRGTSREPAPGWRHGAFFAGLAAVFLALQSPIDPIAERLFLVHQIQHLALRMIGPMLIALAWPQGILIAGLPGALRRFVLAPVIANGAVRGLFGALSHPVAATALFIAALYLWEVPAYHNAALRSAGLHYTMHATMLAAGLIFWWRIFDHRPAPQGQRYGVRVMMLVLVILSNIALGAYTSLKSAVLYDAYDEAGRLFGFTPLADEQFGGMIIWIPSSMMCVLAALAVIHMWGRHESREDVRQTARPSAAAAARPTTGAAMIARQRARNRTLALSFAVFAAAVFVAVVFVGVAEHLSHEATMSPGPSGSQVGHLSPTP